MQQWLANAAELERWLAEREQFLREDWNSIAVTADGVEGVEQKIRVGRVVGKNHFEFTYLEYQNIQHFDDFLATLDAHGPQFEALKRITRLEEAVERMRSEEAEQKQRQQQQQQQQPERRRDTQQIRTLEKKKILQEKRQERERRKTQEISVLSRNKARERPAGEKDGAGEVGVKG